MLTGSLLLLVPPVAYLATLPVFRKCDPLVRWLYRIGGAIIVFGGGATSYYFAAYTGDQGGIAAFFFQLLVIAAFVLFVTVFLAINWLMRKREQRSS